MQERNSSLANSAFGDSAETGLIVAYQSHQDALRFLSSALSQANGVALLQGPAGSGKSTIVKEQFDWSSQEAAVALLDGTHLVPRELIAGMLAQYDVANAVRHDDQMLPQLSNFMTEQTDAGHTPVLIIDNADRATQSALRLLNWLSALESHGSFTLRIILTGRGRLARVLRDDSMRSLARRHPATFALNPLTTLETIIYLRTRLIAAGGERSEKVFPIDVCEKLHELSGGWPGSISMRAIDVMERLQELQSALPVPRLTITRDGEIVDEIELSERQYVIGRAELADIVIEDTYVSKMHAMLQTYSNAIVLIDLNSTNGTTVNSRAVQKSILRNNDVISLGRYRLKIHNVPAISAELDRHIEASDTLTMQSLEDFRRSRARRTIKALQHR